MTQSREKIRGGVNGYGVIGERVADAVAAQDDMLASATSRPIGGTLGDLLGKIDVLVNCTPKGIPAQNAECYQAHGMKLIVLGGEKDDVTGHSSVAEATYAEALDRDAASVVSCCIGTRFAWVQPGEELHG